MKKIILADNSTCCSVCFEMLSAGDEVFVDSDNDVICGNCHQETKIETAAEETPTKSKNITRVGCISISSINEETLSKFAKNYGLEHIHEEIKSSK